MKCSVCGIKTCDHDDCENCAKIFCTGLCYECHKKDKCARCSGELDLRKGEFIQTDSYDYFCSIKCYEEWRI